MTLLLELVKSALCEAEREGPWNEAILPTNANLPFSKVVNDLEAANMIEIKRVGGIESAKLLRDGKEVLRILRDPRFSAQLESSQSVTELREKVAHMKS